MVNGVNHQDFTNAGHLTPGEDSERNGRKVCETHDLRVRRLFFYNKKPPSGGFFGAEKWWLKNYLIPAISTLEKGCR